MSLPENIHRTGGDSSTPSLGNPGIRLALFCMVVALSFLVLLAFHAAFALAYTVEPHDDPVTGQFGISPTKVELDVKQGDVISRDIQVYNRTGSTITIEFSLQDFEGSNDPQQATVFKGNEDGKWSARQWLQPEISSIVLKQGETVTFNTKITIPKDAEAGGHYAALFASSTSLSQNNDGSALNITSQIASLFLIRVEGAVVEVGNLNKPEIPSFSEYGPVNIGLVFNNQGNVHLKPSGHVTITNLLGQVVADVPVPEWVVLPEASRRTVVTWDSHFLFGRYTATAEIGYKSDGSPIVVTTTFWVIPWKIILAAAILLIIIVVALVWWRVRRKRRKRRETDAELEGLRTAKEGIKTVEPTVIEPAAEEKSIVALNAIFPSMGDTGLVDLRDEETQGLIRDIINQETDLARTYIADGRIEEARAELEEARAAARRIGLLAVIGMIDDLLREL